jgi:hypothetical protein
VAGIVLHSGRFRKEEQNMLALGWSIHFGKKGTGLKTTFELSASSRFHAVLYRKAMRGTFHLEGGLRI